MRGSVWVLVVALGAGCEAATTLPVDVGGAWNWEPVDGSEAQDAGGPTGTVAIPDQVPPGPITLVDVSDTAGLAGVPGGGNTHGVGIIFADLDGDSFADIFVINGESNRTGEVFDSRLLINRQDGTFDDRSDASGIAAILAGVDAYSGATGDIDMDGDIDVYVGAQPRDILLVNQGDGTFIDGTAAADAGGPASDPSLVGDGKSKIVSIGDYDNDGDLDLVSATSTLIPTGVYMLSNDGDGTFSDVTAESGVMIDPRGNPCAAMWSDYDTDGDRDLWIWNDRGGHVLLRNENDGRLSDVTEASRLDAVTISNPMGIDAADIDHDGDLDYYVSNIGNNPLLRNNGDGTFVDITDLAGTGGEYGWGLAFEDFDADGWADIFVAQEDDRPNLVFRNLGTLPSTFERIEVPHPSIIDASAAHNVAVGFADYDHDGRVDVVTARTDGTRITLYRNQTDLGSTSWMHVVVAPDGPETVDGIGARIAVSTGDLVQFRDVTGGSSRASQNELSVRFGLGQFRGADWVAVLWPTGRQQVLANVGGNQRVTIP